MARGPRRSPERGGASRSSDGVLAPKLSSGYDAARILADAILRASASTPDAIRDAIEETRGHAGVTGTISIDKAHNVEKPIFVRRVERGKLVYFTTLEPRDEE